MDFLFCAQDETRTHTILRPLPPQSSVYTNFTTCASSECAYRIEFALQIRATAIPPLNSKPQASR